MIKVKEVKIVKELKRSGGFCDVLPVAMFLISLLSQYKTDVASLLALISSCLFWAQSWTDWRVRAQNSGVMPPTDRRVVRAAGTSSCEPISIWWPPPPQPNKQTQTQPLVRRLSLVPLHLQPPTYSPLKAVREYQHPVPGHSSTPAARQNMFAVIVITFSLSSSSHASPCGYEVRRSMSLKEVVGHKTFAAS